MRLFKRLWNRLRGCPPPVYTGLGPASVYIGLDPATTKTCLYCNDQHVITSFVLGAQTMVCDSMPEGKIAVQGGYAHLPYSKAPVIDTWDKDAEWDKIVAVAKEAKGEAAAAVKEYLDLTWGVADKEVSAEFKWAFSDGSSNLKKSEYEKVKEDIKNAYFAVGKSGKPRQLPEVVAFLMEHFNGMDEVVQCPECGVTDPLFEIVQHLNDSVHLWSRERIADWLETLSIDLTMKEKSNAEST